MYDVLSQITMLFFKIDLPRGNSNMLSQEIRDTTHSMWQYLVLYSLWIVRRLTKLATSW